MNTNEKVLFETQYGSSLYGYSTPESDIDIKKIILPDFDSLLLGRVPKNKMKTKQKGFGVKNSADDIDVELIPIQVFAEDFIEGQSYSLELAHAIDYVDAGQLVYDWKFVEFCRELRENFLTSNVKAIIGYSLNQAKLYSNKGERLNAAVAAFELFDTFPHLELVKDHEQEFNLAAKLVQDKFPKYFQVTEYSINPEGEMRPCIKLLEKILPYTGTFGYNLDIIKRQIQKFGSRAQATSEENIDWKAVSHSLRIVNEGITLLSGDKLVFPYEKSYAKYLLDIKQGRIDREIVFKEINDNLDILTDLSLHSSLPKYDNELKAKKDAFLLSYLKKFYNLV